MIYIEFWHFLTLLKIFNSTFLSEYYAHVDTPLSALLIVFLFQPKCKNRPDPDSFIFGALFRFLSPSGDLGIALVWDNHPPHPTPPQLFGPAVEILFKLNSIIDEEYSVVLRMISDDFRCFPMFSAVFRCFPTMFSDCWNPLQAELNYLWWVLSYSQDDIRWF